MKQGIIKETNKEYHDFKEAISKSRLEKMSVCPKYFKWCEDNPNKQTEDLIFGSAFHKYVLEEKTFYDEFVISPNINRRTKAGKEEYDNFVSNAQGKSIISEDQFNKIIEMKNAIFENKYCTKLLNGNCEKSFYFVDDLTEEQCKVRPDCFRKCNHDTVIITDLKSCRSAITENFMRDVVKFGYDLQAYMYCLGASKILNVPIENVHFVFIAVEKESPYLTNVLEADKYVLERGEMLFRKYLGMYHQCKESGNWYGLNGEENIINNLSLPKYLKEE